MYPSSKSFVRPFDDLQKESRALRETAREIFAESKQAIKEAKQVIEAIEQGRKRRALMR
jgi:hypothetical protein